MFDGLRETYIRLYLVTMIDQFEISWFDGRSLFGTPILSTCQCRRNVVKLEQCWYVPLDILNEFMAGALEGSIGGAEMF